MGTRWLLAATLLAACGTTPDDRPKTFEAVTFEVLAPHCGQVQCHSTFTMNEGYAFDTLDAARRSLRADPNTNNLCVTAGDPCDLLSVLNGTDERERMPPDVPLATEDREYLLGWIADGAAGW